MIWTKVSRLILYKSKLAGLLKVSSLLELIDREKP